MALSSTKAEAADFAAEENVLRDGEIRREQDLLVDEHDALRFGFDSAARTHSASVEE